MSEHRSVKLSSGGLDGQPAILIAAEKEFRRKSFKEASMRRIATDAGYAVGTLYFHFGSKEGLFRAVIAPIEKKLFRAIKRIEKKDRDALRSAQNLDEAIALEIDLMNELVEYLLENRHDITLLNQETDDPTRPLFTDHIQKILNASVVTTDPLFTNLSKKEQRSIILFQETQYAAFTYYMEQIISGAYDRKTALAQGALFARFLTVGWDDFLNFFPQEHAEPGVKPRILRH